MAARGVLAIVVTVCGSAPAGCSGEKEPVAVTSPYHEPVTFAVAPVLNFSGEFTLGPVKAADLLASELTDIEGISVMPVSRVVAYLATQGRTQIESPAHAVAVARAVGADAIIVAGVTEYDPYTPVAGLVLQIYRVSSAASPSVDPVLVSRDPRPMALTETADGLAPTSQVQMVYNANHEWVAQAVERYAKHRDEEPSPFGWRQYLKVQTLFLRFCWHDAIERLMREERGRVSLLAGGQDSEPTP